ncbi:A24 family peptidase [Streptomyces sp. APSN-46.1]|uniref:prepilin peptidase n=1 Tax=Streptomyces sp. APSN-46.1 TaxID=2929049 RepID=UPI001FB4803C|nr:A24 family peptidase [Streptomyces sp. APSN-46.1]MCJ1677872.1 A24 family peptidase [Streptomyces sp. APSN-46.1]
MSVVVITVLAAAYGVAAGLSLPRAAYRLSVAPGEPWRDRCPEGHPLPGWLGPAHCRPPETPRAPEAPRAAPGGGVCRAPEAPQAAQAPEAPQAAPGVGARQAGQARQAAPGVGAPQAPEAPQAAPGGGVRGGHRYGVSRLRVGGVSGVVCGAVGVAVGVRPEVAVFVGLAPVLVLLALVDLAVHRLPDLLTLPLAAATAALLGAAALAPRAAGSWRLALLGGAALGASYLLLFLINPAGIGFGDVKLALALGVALGWYGWGVWALGAFLGFVYGALYGLGLVLKGRAGLKAAFPFGPFMAAGTLTGVLWGGFGA